MAYAIVRTVRPKARETPAKPIPSSGNAAANSAAASPEHQPECADKFSCKALGHAHIAPAQK